MRIRASYLFTIALFVLLCAAMASAQDLQTGVTYLCNGERVFIDSCNIRDTSDTSKCMVGHPDTVLPNGLMKYTYETRGDLKKLLPTCKQPSSADVKRAQDFNKKIQDQQDAAMKKAQQGTVDGYAPGHAPRPGSAPGAGAISEPQDPQTREMRRCVTAGRLPAACMGNGLMNSLMGNVNGLLSSMVPGVVGKEVTGPQMAGVFLGAGGWRLEFDEASVALSCQDMIPDSHAYTIAFVNNRAVITISSAPKEVVLTLNGDTLTGAGPVVVAGRLSEGIHDGVDYSGQPVRVYAYRQVTRNCERPALSSKGAGPGVVGMEKNVLEGMFSDGKTAAPTPPGLRMFGTYASAGGFSVEFFPESAILGCGPNVARAYPYTVIADGRQAAVRIDAPSPLSFALGPGNTLDPGGSEPYEVQGRRIIGQDANDDFTFAPLNASCPLAVLAPGQVPSTTVATTSGPAAVAAPAPVLTPGNAVLRVSGGLPAVGGRNPLAGHTFVLMKQSFEGALASSGFAPPAGTSPVRAYLTACANRQPACQQGMTATNASTVSGVKADANGQAQLPGVPPGAYYFFCLGAINNQLFKWDFRIELKPGANSVTLDQSNATPVN